MDHYKLTTILNNVLQNVFKLENVSNIISKFSIYKFGNLLSIIENEVNKPFIIYNYKNNSSMFINSINKNYKNIYLVNNPIEIHTKKFLCIYYKYNKHINVYHSDKIIHVGFLLLYKKILNNLIEYIYKTDKEIYAFIIKYKINNLIYKKNAKNENNLVNKQKLVLLDKLFIHYNFAYSYRFCYLL
jgi:hypothetical protein